MRNTPILVVALGGILAATLGGWRHAAMHAEHTPSFHAQPEDAMPPTELSDLAFLEGAWRMTRDDGSVCEETWSGTDGGETGASLMGMFRWTATGERGGASRFVEIMTLREEPVDGEPALVYRLRHFGMDLKPWEETPIVLHVAEAGGDRMVMRPPEGATSDVVSIEYRLDGETLVCDAVFNHGGERDNLGFVFERID